MNYIYESACSIYKEKPEVYSVSINLNDDNVVFSISNWGNVVLEQTISKSESYSTREVYDLLLSHVKVGQDIVSEIAHSFDNGINDSEMLKWIHFLDDNKEQPLIFCVNALGKKDLEWVIGKRAFDNGGKDYMQYYHDTITKYMQDYQKIQNDILKLQEKKLDDSINKGRKQ